MYKNFFKTAWRNLAKHKLFSFINIFGLASGMTVCMLALTVIKGAYDYDTFHPHANRTFRVLTQLTRRDREHLLAASSPLPLGGYLKKEFAAVDKCTRVYFTHDAVKANDKNLNAKEAYVDADFYNIFGFTLRTGIPATQPQTVVLTTETAERFFGKENPIGHRITLGQRGDFIVTGVLATPPHPSHLKFDLLALINAQAVTDPYLNDWTDEAAAYTYVQLKPGKSSADLKKIVEITSKQANRIVASVTDKRFAFDIQPLNKISPGSIKIYNITDEPILPNLIAISLIGLVILLLAFFNYVNLTLARSLERAREVGIRKVAGARKRQLVLQFLIESVLIAFLSFCLAYVLLHLVSTQPVVHRLIGTVSQDSTLWVYFILFTLIAGLVAGWIPAQVLSSFQPVRVLKGKFNVQLFGGMGLRKTLMVVQFSASLIALVVLVIFYRQSTYMATADYGFERSQIINIPIQAASYNRAAAAFAATAGVEQVSGASGLFGFNEADNRFIKTHKESDSLAAVYFSVTPSFLSTMGLQFVAGKNLPVTNTDKKSAFVVLNEEACRQLHFKNAYDAVDHEIWLNDSTSYTVAGVVKDFHYASFVSSIRPLLLAYNPDEFRVLSLKVAKGAESRIKTHLQKTWDTHFPHESFEMDWLDKQLYNQHLHKDDLVFIGILTGMALSIACLGLLGMVIFTTNTRSKEVGIRKVMGATARQIVFQISKDFMLLLVLAVCIGLPVGFMVGVRFLEQYAYRIPLGAGILISCAAALLCLGGITIGWHTYRTAMVNPVKSLRTE